MDREQSEERIVSWLKDAHAMERALEKALDKQAEHAEQDAAMRSRLIRHRDETRRHAEKVEDALDRYGEERSGLKDLAGRTQTALQGLINGSASDTCVKDVLTGIASEHFEIACYRSLRAAAQAVGDAQTERMCEEILRYEEEMAAFLEGQLARVTRMELAEAGR